jgi:hypothetical protein
MSVARECSKCVPKSKRTSVYVLSVVNRPAVFDYAKHLDGGKPGKPVPAFLKARQRRQAGRTPNTSRPVRCRVPLAARYLAFAAGSRSIRVMCRIATCFTKSSGAFVDFPATPMNTVEPNTHANSGWGTSWLEPSDRNRRKALNGLAWRYSRIWGAVITENKYPLQAADASASTLLVTFSGERLATE